MLGLENMTRYYTLEESQNTDGKRSNEMAGLNDPNLTEINSGIMNPVFGGLTFNTSGRLSHCS